MIYLVLAVLMSALVSIIMRVSEKKRENVVAMFIVNYIICTALSYGFIRLEAKIMAISFFSIPLGRLLLAQSYYFW